jgi:beta-lactamase superfamily II metal-dependent hydrolase
MKFSKKLLALLVAVLISLAVLVSCNQNSDTPTDSDPVASKTEGKVEKQENFPPIDPENIRILASKEGEKSAINFAIVRPKGFGGATAVSKASQTIVKEIASLLGTAPKVRGDSLSNGAEYNSTTYEILVGCTAYPQTAEAAAKCGYGDFIIDVIDNKIVIMAYTDDCLDDASNAFVEALKGGFDAESGVITLKKSEIAGNTTKYAQLSAIPYFEGGSFLSCYDAGTRTADAATQCDEVIISEATPELYDAYLSKLEQSGFKKYTDHTMQECKFATYLSDTHMINVGFYDYYNEVRVIIEPVDAPKPALKSENDYVKVTDSQITMLGLEYEKSEGAFASNGLSVLIRLEDGRFIVVDGGFNRAACANKLVATIKEQSSAYTDTPVIAAWIVTHAHGDHNGMLNGQIAKFEGIEIESFMLNFMAESERARAMETYPDNWSEGEGSNFSKTYDIAEQLGTTVYKIHVGQVFYMADLQMEVLYTLESFGPETCNALNTTSTVIKMTFTNNGNETTYLCTGDATGNGMQISANMYGDYMQCDIVQTCHHGYSTWGNNKGMIEAYTKVNAELVLWPQGLNAYHNYIDKDYNSILFKLPNYKECYVAGGQGDLVIVKLPYVYGKEGNVEIVCAGKCPAEHYYKKAS